jgi:type IV fimbrial biogenesis protein FimT
MSGFTLIELMVTLTILAILLMVGMPTFTVWQANAQIRRVAESLQNDLRQAQAEAIRRNRQIAFALTNDTPDSANPALTPVVTARNWALLSLPLLGSGEGANVAGSTGFILGHTQDTNTSTTITGTNSIICFNSVGRLVAPNTAIANAGGNTCGALPATTAPLEFNINNARADRPLRIQVRLGGQIRMCDPNKSIANSPDGCQ